MILILMPSFLSPNLHNPHTILRATIYPLLGGLTLVTGTLLTYQDILSISTILEISLKSLYFSALSDIPRAVARDVVDTQVNGPSSTAMTDTIKQLQKDKSEMAQLLKGRRHIVISMVKTEDMIHILNVQTSFFL